MTVACAAAAWSSLYRALGLYWGSQFSAFANVQADTGTPVIAILGLLGAGAAPTILRSRTGGSVRSALLALEWPSGVRDTIGPLAAGKAYIVTEGRGVTAERPYAR